MANKRLDQYKGRLTPAQITDGMNAAAENANRLADAAELLLDKGHYPLAASVSCLAIEESGKTSILRSLAVARTDEEVVECWRNYRSHTRKNSVWLLPELVAKGARRLVDLRSLFEDEADHPLVLDQVKQIGFYTDCLGRAHWSRPSEVLHEELASRLVQIARLFAKAEPVAEREIQLWIRHIGPVWKGSMEAMEHALVQWYADMQKEGLRARGKNAMEQFILDGVGDQEEQDDLKETDA